MAQPTTSQVHVDTALTNVAIAYKQSVDKLIADKVFPVVPVSKQSDKILKFTKDYWMQVKAGIRAPGTESKGGGFEISSEQTYFCDIHAFHVDLADATVKNADIDDLERQVTEFVMWQLLLEREADWVSNFFDDSGKTPGTDFWTVKTHAASGADYVWWTSDSSDPVDEILELCDEVAKNTGFRPNILVLSPPAFRALKMHSKIQSQVVYTPTAKTDVKALVTPEMLADLFELDKVLVGYTAQATHAEGASSTSYSFVFGDDALLVYAPPNPGLLIPTGGYIFEWTGYNSGYSVAVSSFYMDHLKATRIEGEMAYDAKIMAPDLGVFLKNCGASA